MAFVISPDQPPADEIRRIAGEQLGSALATLAGGAAAGPEAAVHAVRKHCKRVRALVRLVQPALGSEHRRTNAAVRDASAALSPLRDAHAVLSTFDALCAARPDLVPSHGFHAVRAGLAERAEHASDASSAGERFAVAAQLLGETADRVGSWRLKIDLGDVIDGAAEFQGRARRAFRATLEDGSDEALHEWRKRVKDTWYHTQLLCPLAPSVLGAAEKSLSNLSDALGDGNDLAVLSRVLLDATDELGGGQAYEALASIQVVREELLHRCRPLGARLAAERRSEYRARLRGYAKANRAFGPELRVRDIGRMFEPAASR